MKSLGVPAHSRRNYRDFLRHVFTVSSGTLGAQILGLALGPVLTRLYSAAAFGHFAIYLTTSALLAPLATGRYFMAIMLPEDEREAGLITYLCLALSLAAGLVLLVAISLAYWAIGSPSTAWFWIRFLPASICLYSCYQVLSVWAQRGRQFKTLAITRILQVGIMMGVQLALAPVQARFRFLIWGDLAGYCAANLWLLLTLTRSRPIPIEWRGWQHVRTVLVRYKAFPLYTSWGGVMDALTAGVPAYLLTYFYGSAVTGFYSIGNRVVQAPISLLGQSISVVLFQAGAEIRRAGRSLSELVEPLLIKILAFAGLVSISLVIAGPQFFGMIFGQAWGASGVFIRILAPVLLTGFASNSLSTVLVITEKQQALTAIQSGLLLVSALSLGLSSLVLKNVNQSLAVYTVSMTLMYTGYLIVILRSASVSFPRIVELILRRKPARAPRAQTEQPVEVAPSQSS